TPPYVIYYLHLYTYPCPTSGSIPCQTAQSIAVVDPSPLPGCEGMIKLPLPDNSPVRAGCLVAQAGAQGTPNPHLHFEVQKIVPSCSVSKQFGAQTYASCDDPYLTHILGAGFDCIPIDPYGWTGPPVPPARCPNQTTSGDPY